MRRKGKYASRTFRLKSHATERLIDIGCDPVPNKFGNPRTFAGLVELHIADLLEVGKPIRRSKRAVLNALKHNLGTTRIPNLDRATLIKYGKKRAKQGAGPVTLSIDLSYKRLGASSDLLLVEFIASSSEKCLAGFCGSASQPVCLG